jgi:hypothetical protein
MWFSIKMSKIAKITRSNGIPKLSLNALLTLKVENSSVRLVGSRMPQCP